MNEVKDHASYEDESSRENIFSYQVHDNQTSHIRAQFSNISLLEVNETIIIEDDHSYFPSANSYASIEDSSSQAHLSNIIYVIRTSIALQNFLTIQPFAFIKVIRLMLLYSLEFILLTQKEKRGFYDSNITFVFAA